MAEEPARPPGPFDVRTVKSLVALMTQHDLAEIDLRDGTARLRLRRGHHQPLTMLAHPPLAVPAAAPATPAAPPKNDTPAGTSTPAAPARPLVEIKSPTVGTFYAKPNPDAQPYIKVGSKVTPTMVVCLIEAMKLYNEVLAECSGTIVEILVDNQQPVEYGQVLFRVDPTA